MWRAVDMGDKPSVDQRNALMVYTPLTSFAIWSRNLLLLDFWRYEVCFSMCVSEYIDAVPGTSGERMSSHAAIGNLRL